MACLALCISWVGGQRHGSPADIDGEGLSSKPSPQLLLLRALLHNTQEQTLLAVGLYYAWALAMPLRVQGAVPVAACLFVLGRVLFYKGYAKGAEGRAFGFALTFLPSLGLLVGVCGWVGLRDMGVMR